MLCSLWFTLPECNHKPNKTAASKKYNSRIYQTEIDQFGYDIYQDSVVIIHQPIIPGLQGNKGFATKDDAQKVANLVVQKMEKGIMPPTISLHELDSVLSKAVNQ